MRTLVLVLALLTLSACGSSHEKTGEAMLLNSDKLKVKVVQFYDDMPLHYYGLTHQIWCQSPKTMDIAWVGVEKGWNEFVKSGISEPGNSPSKEVQRKVLDAAVLDAKKRLWVLSDNVIAYADYGTFTVTLNGCNNFSTWVGWNLPADKVIQAEKPKYCKEGDCQWENFRGDNEIIYTNLKTDGESKRISFSAHSKAFKDGDLLVQSEDGGIHWSIK